MAAEPRVVIVPWPIWVSASWLDRYNQTSPRKPKTRPEWPLRQSIPDRRAVNEILERTRRDLADRRASQLLRELERSP
jgi:hypothetical protein